MCNERLHEGPSPEQMHPYVDKVRTVGYLDETGHAVLIVHLFLFPTMLSNLLV